MAERRLGDRREGPTPRRNGQRGASNASEGLLLPAGVKADLGGISRACCCLLGGAAVIELFACRLVTAACAAGRRIPGRQAGSRCAAGQARTVPMTATPHRLDEPPPC